MFHRYIKFCFDEANDERQEENSSVCASKYFNSFKAEAQSRSRFALAIKNIVKGGSIFDSFPLTSFIYFKIIGFSLLSKVLPL